MELMALGSFIQVPQNTEHNVKRTVLCILLLLYIFENPLLFVVIVNWIVVNAIEFFLKKRKNILVSHSMSS